MSAEPNQVVRAIKIATDLQRPWFSWQAESIGNGGKSICKSYKGRFLGMPGSNHKTVTEDLHENKHENEYSVFCVKLH